LLPIILPRVQWSWVAGFGPNISWCSASCSLSSSSTMPGSTTQVRAAGSTETRPRQYLDQSMTTAALHDCPARLVPPPRDTTGTLCPTQTFTASGGGLDGAGHHDADRHLAVVRRVRAVGAAAARVEPDLAVDPLPQVLLERTERKRHQSSPRRRGCTDGQVHYRERAGLLADNPGLGG
jgi:hypothetical protein